ncbi:unnamed protein product [Symbiodinium sp. CCMP2592]|nr:unnamed protein product [Symbiodinium sp. CCMP2592]
MARGDRGERDRDRDRGRDERARATRSEAREDFESLRTKVEKVEDKLARTSHLALQASKDAGEVRAAHQLVVFLKGLARERVKEVVAEYQGEKDAVLQGLKDKGAPLKLRVYEALLKKLEEVATTKGAETAAVAKELVELGTNSVVNSVTNGAKPPEGDVPWVLVLTFHYSEVGQKAKRLWSSAALRPCFAKTGGGWPELGVREGSWRPGRLHQAVAEDLGLPPKGKGRGSAATGVKRQSESPGGTRRTEMKPRMRHYIYIQLGPASQFAGRQSADEQASLHERPVSAHEEGSPIGLFNYFVKLAQDFVQLTTRHYQKLLDTSAGANGMISRVIAFLQSETGRQKILYCIKNRNVQQQLASLLKASEEATSKSASAASASSGDADGNTVKAAEAVEEIQMDLDTDAAGEEKPLESEKD